MKVIAILESESEPAKSTIALTLATAAAESGIKVRILDLDPGATSTRWGERRSIYRPGAWPDVQSLPAVRLRASLTEAESANIDLTVIDTTSGNVSDALCAARACDLAIMPCFPAITDLKAIQTTLSIVEAAHKKSQSFVLLSTKSARDYERVDVEGAIEALRRVVQIAPVCLRRCKACQRSAMTGEGVVETEPTGKAAREAREFALWALQQAEINAAS